MQYELAPMEGITTYIYRNAHAKYFGGIDRYYTPFISDKNLSDTQLRNSLCDPETQHRKCFQSMNTRELRDILPENNVGIPLVPQVLTNNAGRFLAVSKELASYGYDTVNLNLGCPSGTVTAKKRGAGFLSVPDELDAFFYEIYEKCPLRISIKTRLGVSDLREWDRLLDIYAKYPIHELIIHTRLLQEFYTGRTHPEAYIRAIERLQTDGSVNSCSRIPLCYNGDINSVEDLREVISIVNHALTQDRHTSGQTGAAADIQEPVDSGAIDHVMIGRGIIQNPALARHLHIADASAHAARPDIPAAGVLRSDTGNTFTAYSTANSKEVLRAFHDEILEGYREIMSGDSPVLFKMKDLWTYMSRSFTNSGKYLKKIRKANRLADYVSAVDGLFREQETTV